MVLTEGRGQQNTACTRRNGTGGAHRKLRNCFTRLAVCTAMRRYATQVSCLILPHLSND
jgi:hypothetical protein